jgi:hypothetical protein
MPSNSAPLTKDQAKELGRSFGYHLVLHNDDNEEGVLVFERDCSSGQLNEAGDPLLRELVSSPSETPENLALSSAQARSMRRTVTSITKPPHQNNT